MAAAEDTTVDEAAGTDSTGRAALDGTATSDGRAKDGRPLVPGTAVGISVPTVVVAGAGGAVPVGTGTPPLGPTGLVKVTKPVEPLGTTTVLLPNG